MQGRLERILGRFLDGLTKGRVCKDHLGQGLGVRLHRQHGRRHLDDLSGIVTDQVHTEEGVVVAMSDHTGKSTLLSHRHRLAEIPDRKLADFHRDPLLCRFPCRHAHRGDLGEGIDRTGNGQGKGLTPAQSVLHRGLSLSAGGVGQ